MPYLIRSAGGERTAIPIGSKRQVGVVREDLIEALRGLTIKFELKISDVLATDPDNVAKCNGNQDQSDNEKESEIDTNSSAKSNEINEHSIKVTSPVKLSLANGIASAAIVQVMNGIKLETQPQEESKQKEESRPEEPKLANSESKEEFKLEQEYNPTNDDIVKLTPQNSDEVLHPNMRPRLVNEFRSSIRPISTLRSESVDRPRASLNFMPLSVLKKQVENHIKPQVKSGPNRPVFVDPLGTNLITKRAVLSPVRLTEDKRSDYKPAEIKKEDKPAESTVKQDKLAESYMKQDKLAGSILKQDQPVESYVKQDKPADATSTVVNQEPNRPSITWGRIQVGSVISTCLLSEDSPITYITYNNDKILEVTSMLKDLATEIEVSPKIRSVNVHDIVLGRSAEDNCWYRAIVTEVQGTKIDLFYVDWGSSETLDLDRIRYLCDSRLSLAAKPSCAVKVKITNEPSERLREILSEGFKVKVESYDEFDEIYTITVAE